MKILVIAISGIGDALLFTPALQLLHKQFPEARIDVLTKFSDSAELFANNPAISKVYYHDFVHANPIGSLWYLLKMRLKRYDRSILVYPANCRTYNFLSFLVGAKQRAGHEYNYGNVRYFNFLNNLRVHEDDGRHNVEENLRLVEHLGVRSEGFIPELQLSITEENRRIAERMVQRKPLPDDMLRIGIHAGSSKVKNHFQRRWSPEKYSHLAMRLIKKYNAAIFLFGGPDEDKLNESINHMMDRKAVIVKTSSLMETAAAMEKCSLFISNDALLMHVAAALHLPTIAIFAYTNPRKVFPWKTEYTLVRHDLECSPCFFHSPRSVWCKWSDDQFRCITHIEVDEVERAVDQMVQRKILNRIPA